MTKPARYHGKPLLSNHQKSWLWGAKAVFETLEKQRWPVYELLIAGSAQQEIHQTCADLAEQRGIPVRFESVNRLKQLCQASDHQGLLALMGPFPYVGLSEIKQEVGQAGLVVALDQVQDPHNLGAIIRSAAAFGIDGILLGSEQQVGVTSHVARSSAGIVNHIPIARVKCLRESLEELSAAQYQIFATMQQGNVTLPDLHTHLDPQTPRAVVVIGNEASGVSQEVVELAENSLSIPMSGEAESLNAAVAAGVVMYQLSLLRR